MRVSGFLSSGFKSELTPARRLEVLLALVVLLGLGPLFMVTVLSASSSLELPPPDMGVFTTALRLDSLLGLAEASSSCASSSSSSSSTDDSDRRRSRICENRRGGSDMP